MFVELEKRVESYLQLKQEGASWDFKRQWHENKTSLLHDIICMANSVTSEDSVLIIGCDEENGHCLVDQSSNPNRKNTADVVTFLRDKPFAGGVRPIAFVHSMKRENVTIDILVVKSTRETPYYLIKQIEGVRAYHIYSRVMDTNTPLDTSADLNIVERLWQKRFALDASALEKAQRYLESPNDWITTDGACSYYYKYAPEYTIIQEADDSRNGYEYYLFGQTDRRPHWYNVYVKCHQTVLLDASGVALDGGRYFTVCPELNCMKLENASSVLFRAFVSGSLQYVLHRFFYEREYSEEARYAHDRFCESILFFFSEDEKKKFLSYAAIHYNDAKMPTNMFLPYFPDSLETRQDPKAFEQDYKRAMILKGLLDEFRRI